MSFLLANFLGNSGNSNASSSSNSSEDKQLIIEKLTAKMVNSAHLEDRKAAAQTIKSLARSHRLEIGTLALQALIDELRRDLEDEELAKIVLETLDILCSNSNNKEDALDANVSSNGIEVQFCEILLKNEQNVALLLDIMGDSDDFYLLFTSIQILMSLCASQPFQLKSAVLNSPAGVSKVLDLIKDSREIVRNEGLLLCGALVDGNADLQKILAFQGAFEQVMQIIVEEEGPWMGQLIIQDAFNLISGMLNLNTANQMYFRDSVCFKQLAGLISLPENETETSDTLFLWNRTRISNYLAALNVLDGLLCKSNVDLEASQNSALKTHFLRPLLALAFKPKIPVEVSASALNCLSGLIYKNNRTQQEFAKEKLTQSPLVSTAHLPISPLMGAVMVAVNQTQDGGLVQRFKALDLVEAFCSNNPEGQLILLSTLKSAVGSSASPGSVILEALFDLDSSRKRDLWHCWFASALLCHLINENENAKRVLLKQQTAFDDESESEDILTVLMLSLIRSTRDLRGSSCQKTIVGYLQLLLIWFHEFPEAINRFLQEGSYVQFLIERITHQSFTLDTQIQGLSALIMGICVLFNDESVKNFGSEGLKGIIKNRIGPDLFISKLAHLKSEKDEIISEMTCEILLKNYENLMNLVARPTPAGSRASHTATLAQLNKDLGECRALLSDTQTHLTQNGRLIETLKLGITERDSYILQLQKLISEKNQKIAQMAHEMSNLEQQTQQRPSNTSSNDHEALNNLKETIKSFQETVSRQQARIEELEALLNGHNNLELEKWKEAYHKLHDQVQLQLQLNFSTSNEGDGELELKECGNFSESDLNYESEPIAIESDYSKSELENDFENVTVTSAFCPVERITVTSAFCSEDSGVEILSPSMFMSPLAEEGDQIVLVSEDENAEERAGSSPELISLNQLPEAHHSLSEYPDLKESINTSFNAAVIVSEEFAKNQPNPAEDEHFVQIQNESPPYNFLASSDEDTGNPVEIVSKEEIRSVLDFFDRLPQEESVSNSSEVKSIQEGLNNLHFTEKTEDKIDMEFGTLAYQDQTQTEVVVQDENIQEIIRKQSENIQEISDQDNHEIIQNFDNQEIVQDYNNQEIVQDHYVQETSQDSGQDINQAQEIVQDQFSHDSSIQEDYFTQEVTQNANDFQYANYDQVQEGPNEFFTQEPVESSIVLEPTQEYNGEPITFEQSFTEATSLEHEQSHDFIEKCTNEPQDYIQLCDSHPQDNNQGYTDSNAYDYQPQNSTTSEQSQEYATYEQSQDYTNYYQSQEHTSSEQSHDNTTYDQSLEYTNYEQPQDFNETSAYEQSQAEHIPQYQTHNDDQEASGDAYEHSSTNAYASEYTEGYTDTANVLNYEEAVIQDDQQILAGDQQSVELSFTNASEQQSYTGYAASNITECAHVDTYKTTIENQIDYNTPAPVHDSNTQTYDEQPYNQAYVQEQLYDHSHEQAYDNSQEQMYDHGQEQSYDYCQDQSQEQAYEQSQEQSYDYSQDQANVQSYEQSQEQPSAEYYYYDEATGYTYGFDQNVNQYYYYDPNTGEYTYYTAESGEGANNEYTSEPTSNNTSESSTYNTSYATEYTESYANAEYVSESVASSNPSLFDNIGPPMIPLQQHQSSTLSTNNFVTNQEQQQQEVYNL